MNLFLRATNTVRMFLQLLAETKEEEAVEEIDVGEIAAKMKQLFKTLIDEPKTPTLVVPDEASGISDVEKMHFFKEISEHRSTQSNSPKDFDDLEEIM